MKKMTEHQIVAILKEAEAGNCAVNMAWVI
jgi:hypothetical protein